MGKYFGLSIDEVKQLKNTVNNMSSKPFEKKIQKWQKIEQEIMSYQETPTLSISCTKPEDFKPSTSETKRYLSFSDITIKHLKSVQQIYNKNNPEEFNKIKELKCIQYKQAQAIKKPEKIVNLDTEPWALTKNLSDVGTVCNFIVNNFQKNLKNEEKDDAFENVVNLYNEGYNIENNITFGIKLLNLEIQKFYKAVTEEEKNQALTNIDNWSINNILNFSNIEDVAVEIAAWDPLSISGLLYISNENRDKFKNYVNFEKEEYEENNKAIKVHIFLKFLLLLEVKLVII